MQTPPALAFLTGSPGPGELILLFVVVLVLFGPKRLPEIARTIGKTVDQLRRASQDFRDQIMRLDRPAPEDHARIADVEDLAGAEEEHPVEDDATDGDEAPGEKTFDDLAG